MVAGTLSGHLCPPRLLRLASRCRRAAATPPPRPAVPPTPSETSDPAAGGGADVAEEGADASSSMAASSGHRGADAGGQWHQEGKSIRRRLRPDGRARRQPRTAAIDGEHPYAAAFEERPRRRAEAGWAPPAEQLALEQGEELVAELVHAHGCRRGWQRRCRVGLHRKRLASSAAGDRSSSTASGRQRAPSCPCWPASSAMASRANCCNMIRIMWGRLEGPRFGHVY
jgi:hypothetical protein